MGFCCRSTLNPTLSEQSAHRYSYLSPSGRTRSRRWRTGTERRHRGQYSSVASNCLNVSGRFCCRANAPGCFTKYFGFIAAPITYESILCNSQEKPHLFSMLSIAKQLIIFILSGFVNPSPPLKHRSM